MSSSRQIAIFFAVVVALFSAGQHYHRSLGDTKKIKMMEQDASAFGYDGSFMAEAVLRSPSGKVLESPAGKVECVAYSTRVELHEIVRDTKGRTGEDIGLVFKAQKHTADMVVEFEQGQALLSLISVKRFFTEKMSRVEECPEFVPSGKRPAYRGERHWFHLYEETFAPGGRVFVIAQMKPDNEFLAAHPEFGELVVFQGSRDELIANLRADAEKERGEAKKVLLYLALGLTAVGAFVAFQRRRAQVTS